MPKHDEKTYRLLGALSTVEMDARKQIEYCERMLSELPKRGHTEDEHKEYWAKRLEEAIAGKHWAFIRYMMIDPD